MQRIKTILTTTIIHNENEIKIHAGVQQEMWQQRLSAFEKNVKKCEIASCGMKKGKKAVNKASEHTIH